MDWSDGIQERGGPRTSALAVSSMVLGALCPVPFLGALALITGGVALVLIGRSGGRLGGKGFALTGVVLGLIASVFWVVLLGTAVQIGRGYARVVAGPVGAVVQAAEAGDVEAVRAAMTEEAGQRVDAEALRAWVEGYAGQVGDLVDTPDSLWELVRAAMAAGPALQRGDYGRDRVPVLATFSRGPGLIVVRLPEGWEEASADGLPAFEDIGVVAGAGGVIWLVGGAGSVGGG